MDLGDIFKDLVWDALVNVALRQLFATIPILGWGPIGLAVGWLVGFLTDKLYAAMRESVEMQAIVLRNEAHRKAYDRAGAVLRIIAFDKGIDSPEFQEARDAHKAALSQFVRFAD